MYSYIRRLPLFWLGLTGVFLLLAWSLRAVLLQLQSAVFLPDPHQSWLMAVQLLCALGCALLVLLCLPSHVRARQSEGGWGFWRLLGGWLFCAVITYAGLGALHSSYLAQLTPLQRQNWLLTDLLQQERANSVAKNTSQRQLRQLFFPPLLLDEPRYATLSQAQIEALVKKTISAQLSSASVHSIQQMIDFNQRQLQPVVLGYGYLKQTAPNLTGYSDAALQQMYQYVADNFATAQAELPTQASLAKVGDGRLLQAEYEKNLLSALQHAMSGLGRDENFQQQLDANFNYPALFLGQDQNTTQLQQHLQAADVMLAGLWQQQDFAAIRHYYPFVFDLKSQCQIQAAAKPQWSFVLSQQPFRQWSAEDQLQSSELMAVQATFIVQLTGQRVSSPQSILCDLSFETVKRQRQALRAFLEKQSPLYRHRLVLEALAQPTHFQHRLFERQLKNQQLFQYLTSNELEQCHEFAHPWLRPHDALLIRRFTTQADFQAVFGGLEYSSAAAFARSMKQQFYLEFRTRLFQNAAALGFDLKPVWQNPVRPAKNARDLAQMPFLQAAIANKIPFAFTHQGRLVQHLSEYQQFSVGQQQQLRSYYQHQLQQFYYSVFFAAEADYPQPAAQQSVQQWLEFESQRLWLLMAITFLLWGLVMHFIVLCVPATAQMSLLGRGLLFSALLLLPFIFSYSFAPGDLNGGARLWHAGFQFNLMLQLFLDLLTHFEFNG